MLAFSFCSPCVSVNMWVWHTPASQINIFKVIFDVEAPLCRENPRALLGSLQRRLRAPGSRLWVVGSRLWAVGCGLWASDSRLWAPGCGLWAVGCGLWASGSRLWALGCGLWAPGCGLWALGSGLWAVGSGLWPEGSGLRFQSTNSCTNPLPPPSVPHSLWKSASHVTRYVPGKRRRAWTSI